MKACIGFEDQNGKKVAITAASAVDFRPIINENSIISTHNAMVTTSKSASAAGRKTANVTENVSQSSNASRPVGKRRKSESWNFVLAILAPIRLICFYLIYSLCFVIFPAATEVGNKRGTYKTHASTDLIQVAGNEGQVQDSKQ